MKIILKKDIEKLGNAGEIVETKRGYARNFLIPNGSAVEASSVNMKIYEQERHAIEQKRQQEIAEAQVFANKLNGVSITATVQVGEEDKVFGAVTSQNLADLLAEKGVELDRRKIVLDEPLKALGVFEVPVKLHAQVEAQIKVWVVRE
jgi:large subunit ribosomal protein L9